MAEKRIVHEVIKEVLSINFPKFELRRGTRQSEQHALDYWSFRLKYFLARIPPSEQEGAKELCLLTLGQQAYHSIPASAKTPEDVLEVLQHHVDGLDDDRPQEAINEIRDGKNPSYYIEQLTNIEYNIRIKIIEQYEVTVHRLVDTVIDHIKHIPHIDTVLLAIPESYDAPARIRFKTVRDGLKKIKGVYGDAVPFNKNGSKKFSTYKPYNGQQNRNQSSNNNNGGNNKDRPRNNSYQGKKNFQQNRNGNGQGQPRNNSGYQFTQAAGNFQSNGNYQRQHPDDMELDYVNVGPVQNIETPKESSQQ